MALPPKSSSVQRPGLSPIPSMPRTTRARWRAGMAPRSPPGSRSTACAPGPSASVRSPPIRCAMPRGISPGGIEAWLVRQDTVPLISLEFAFTGGASQDPADKPGVANMVGSLLDEGAGERESRSYPERLEDKAIELSFRVGRDYVNGSLRMLNDSRNDAVGLMRLAL